MSDPELGWRAATLRDVRRYLVGPAVYGIAAGLVTGGIIFLSSLLGVSSVATVTVVVSAVTALTVQWHLYTQRRVQLQDDRLLEMRNLLTRLWISSPPGSPPAQDLGLPKSFLEEDLDVDDEVIEIILLDDDDDQVW